MFNENADKDKNHERENSGRKCMLQKAKMALGKFK